MFEARLVVHNVKTGRGQFAEIPGEAFDLASGLTDEQVWERYLKPALHAVREGLARPLIPEDAQARGLS